MTDMFNIAKPVYVGVSACLLGQNVRYDGGHKRQDWMLGNWPEGFEIIAVCPEAEAGLGTPRPPVQLVATEQGVKALGVDDAGLDVTATLMQYAEDKLNHLTTLSGYIFKARSPSCGLAAPLQPHGVHPGLFALAIHQRWPQMPVIEEQDLLMESQRLAFFERVREYADSSH